jgi:sec-independent protein translocase protein TatA
MLHLLAWGMPGGPDWIIIAALGLLLFGKRLPEVGRSLGKGIVEFKKGLKGVEDDVTAVDDHLDATPARTTTPAQPQYKFDPYTGKPVDPALPAGAKFDPFTGKPVEDTTVSAAQPMLESQAQNG